MHDEFAWLEDVDGADALEWVRRMNGRTERELFTDVLFEELRAAALEILEADDRIPMPARHGDAVLNFWTDADNRRGVLRRTTWEQYAAGDPDWETLLDIDALGRAEGTTWVFKGSSVRRPDRRRMLVELSPGGSDASVTREFDLVERRFVSPDEGGFVRPLSKGSLDWIDDDAVYVSTDFGPGTMTRSGYPRTVRRWRRGTALAESSVVFEGEDDDVAISAHVTTTPGYRHHLIYRVVDFYNSRKWIVRDGSPVEIEVPTDVEIDLHAQWILFSPRHDWTTGGRRHLGGSLLAARLDDFLAGARDLVVVFDPGPTTSLGSYCWTRNMLLLQIQDDVRDRVEVCLPEHGWASHPLDDAPSVWSIALAAVDSDESDDCLLVGHDFVTPPTLYLASKSGPPTVLRSAPAQFDADGRTIEQRFVTSLDGTRVPYFLIGRAARGGGPGPALLGGYGGFEVSRKAVYTGVLGRAWLAAGGAYALANLRGGGEYGPAWHQAGLRENRHRIYEDFEAVARDLIDTGVTTAARLGISGGSNGGLLVGNMYVRTPELFGAVVCQVPLLDMKRYPHLLAGASWMAEYGDPDDPVDWEFIRTFSPYHLIEADRAYPPILLTTSTRDDRVHPGHARKMAAALAALGHDVTYWENIEGGHAGAADAGQQAVMQALAYTFLRRRLMG